MKAFVFVLLINALLCYRNPFFNSIKFEGRKANEYTAEHLTPQFGENDENPFENSGYILVNEKYGGYMHHVFFYAANGNMSAPLIIWLNGGPGCSSLGGLFMENGPYRIDPDTLKIYKHEHAWSDTYHMLFIDNPVGSGYSYVEDEKGYVTTQDEVADQLYTFLNKFFEKHPDVKDNDIYIFGESYAGKYVPSISRKIVHEGFKYNLKGMAIGDGLTHPIDQFNHYTQLAVTTGMIDEGEDVAKMYDLENKTIEAIKKKDWEGAFNGWEETCEYMEVKSGGINVYDIRTHEQYDFTPLTDYANLDSTRKLMHADGHKFEFCSGKVYEKLAYDMPKSVLPWFMEVLNTVDTDREVKVMIYSGQFDLIVPTTSTINGFTFDLDWKYGDQYRKAERTVFEVAGKWGGWKKSYKNLFSVNIGEAGHMVPMDQPVVSKEMLDAFIRGKF